MPPPYEYDVNGREDYSYGLIMAAVAAQNPSEQVFFRSPVGELCTYNGEEFVPNDPDHLAVRLRQFIRPFRVVTRKGGIEEEVEAPISKRLALAYLKGKSWPGACIVDSIQRAPFVRPDYSIRWKEGYDEETKSYVIPGIPYVDPTSAASVDEIKKLFTTFAFRHPSDVADAIGYAITILIMKAIREPVPMWMIAATREGSGKTALLQATARLGGEDEMISLPWADEAEIRKELVASLRTSTPGPIFFDNVKDKVDSQIVESILTSRTFKGRILGTSNDIVLRVDVPLFISLNNPSLSKDMKRRGVFTLLDKDTNPVPWDDGLMRYITEHQPRYVNGLVRMIEDWRDAGAPEWSGRAMSNFEEWSRVVGGILEHNGIHGFLSSQSSVAVTEIASDEDEEAMIAWAIAKVMWNVPKWEPMDLFARIRIPHTGGGAHAAPVGGGYSVPDPSVMTERAFLEDWLRLPSNVTDKGGATRIGHRLAKLKDRWYTTRHVQVKLQRVGREWEVKFRKGPDDKSVTTGFYMWTGE